MLFDALSSLLDTSQPAGLGPGPRQGVLAITELDSRVAQILAKHGAESTGSSAMLVRAVVLLWHDHLEAAHVLAQEVETVDGSYVHAIMHRREPDYGNAKYWFRRVGEHVCYRELSERAATVLKDSEGFGRLAARLRADDGWDAMAFVDACAEAARKPAGDGLPAVLRRIQQEEFAVLLKQLCPN